MPAQQQSATYYINCQSSAKDKQEISQKHNIIVHFVLFANLLGMSFFLFFFIQDILPEINWLIDWL